MLFKGTGNTDYYKAGLPDGYGNYDVYEMGYIPFHKAVVGNVPALAGIQGNRWTPAWYSGDPSTENPDAMFPRLTYGKNENNTQNTDMFNRDFSAHCSACYIDGTGNLHGFSIL